MLREKNRKAKNKFITVHPTHSCELCYHELLTKAFYVFHCGHGYHRECLIEALEHYETKNIHLRTLLDQIKQFHSEIQTIKHKHELAVQDSMPREAETISWYSNIKRRIKDSIAPSEMREDVQMSREDATKIRELFSIIDGKLKEECYLCGQMLLDQLDNDIALDEMEKDEVDTLYYSEKHSWNLD